MRGWGRFLEGTPGKRGGFSVGPPASRKCRGFQVLLFLRKRYQASKRGAHMGQSTLGGKWCFFHIHLLTSPVSGLRVGGKQDLRVFFLPHRTSLLLGDRLLGFQPKRATPAASGFALVWGTEGSRLEAQCPWRAGQYAAI